MIIGVIGSGGREHAICYKLSQSKKLNKLICIPGNAGTKKIAENIVVSLVNHQEILRLAQEKKIDLTVVGSENPLADGIVDAFRKAGLRIFGPDAYGAQLESSKLFARDLMAENNIPHPDYYSCSTKNEAETLKEILELPVVLKVDGLAGGKGVFVCTSVEDALKNTKEITNSSPKDYPGNVKNRINYTAPPLSKKVNVLPVIPTEIYVQTGTFSKLQNALRMRDKVYKIGPTQISRHTIGGNELFRVRIGPMDNIDVADKTLLQLAKSGVVDARLVVE